MTLKSMNQTIFAFLVAGMMVNLHSTLNRSKGYERIEWVEANIKHLISCRHNSGGVIGVDTVKMRIKT
jgi:hypothetical protein